MDEQDINRQLLDKAERAFDELAEAFDIKEEEQCYQHRDRSILTLVRAGNEGRILIRGIGEPLAISLAKLYEEYPSLMFLVEQYHSEEEASTNNQNPDKQ